MCLCEYVHRKFDMMHLMITPALSRTCIRKLSRLIMTYYGFQRVHIPLLTDGARERERWREREREREREFIVDVCLYMYGFIYACMHECIYACECAWMRSKASLLTLPAMRSLFSLRMPWAPLFTLHAL